MSIDLDLNNIREAMALSFILRSSIYLETLEITIPVCFSYHLALITKAYICIYIYILKDDILVLLEYDARNIIMFYRWRKVQILVVILMIALYHFPSQCSGREEKCTIVLITN